MKSGGDACLRAHLELTSARGAGQWLHTVPNKACRKAVDPLQYKTMIQQWLRSPVFDCDFPCPQCEGIVDRFGDHCLVCSGGGDRTRRHNCLRNEVFHLCASAGLAPELEKPGLLCPRPDIGARPENGGEQDSDPSARRPADVYLPRWKLGLPAALDFAVTSGLRTDLLTASTQNASAAPSAYKDHKRTYLNTEDHCRTDGITFLPVVAEALGGGWGPTDCKVWAELAKRKASITGELESTVVGQVYQSLGLILHRENARAILRRGAPAATFDHHSLAAGLTLQYATADQRCGGNDD